MVMSVSTYSSQKYLGLHARATMKGLGSVKFHGQQFNARGMMPDTSSSRHQRRMRLMVQANELNKWAGRSMDDECPENPFDRETAGVLLRVLTARSVKRVLMQVSEFDLVAGQWFNNFCSENPPTEGNKFILALLHAKGTTIFDPANQSTHNVDPQKLAHRVLQTRADMAAKATMDLPNFTELENTTVLRSYLESNTYIAGDAGENQQFKERRGYIRKRSSAPPKKE